MRLSGLFGGSALAVGIVLAALWLASTTDPGNQPKSAGAAHEIETAPAFESSPLEAPLTVTTAALKPGAAATQGARLQTVGASGAFPEPDSDRPLAPHIEKRIAELEELGTLDDPASLKAILAELANPQPQIRKAALDATVQFSSRDAIPGLAEAAARATDPEEKKAILDAIEFLKLPSLTEVLQRRAKAKGP